MNIVEGLISDLEKKIREYKIILGKIEKGEDIIFEGKEFSKTAYKYNNYVKNKVVNFLNDPK